MPLPRPARLLLALLALAAAPSEAAVTGDYLESRTADVWTGPCFANGEVNLAGKEAILAWRVREGSFAGVPLAGLAVVAVLDARATLGDPHGEPGPVRALLLVDERAGAAEREALVALARRGGGGLLADVVAVEPAPIRLELDAEAGEAALAAGDAALLRTRALGGRDRHCGNEDVYYPPLATLAEARPAVALVQSFRGPAFGRTWTVRGKRSAFVGSFSF